MAITLSHQSALDVVRTLRCAGDNIQEMEVVPLSVPSAWVGERLGPKNFAPAVWRWEAPTRRRPLHVLVPNDYTRVRGKDLVAHIAWPDLPAGSVLWLDEHSSMVCPELLFLQMASVLSFSALVMLGMELCGHFSRWPDNPMMAGVVDEIPAATSVERMHSYLAQFKRVKGLGVARKALCYVRDHAASAPEAVLAAMLGLPTAEGGYGLGSVVLNERVTLKDVSALSEAKSRYPDLMLELAPVGLNYDGAKHFDVADLIAAAEAFSRAEGKEKDAAREDLKSKLEATRAKVIDDNLRDRQLAAQGRIVFSATKEDLSEGKQLDELVRQILSCAREVFGADVSKHLEAIDNTLLARERWELLDSLLPRGNAGVSSYGKL